MVMALALSVSNCRWRSWIMLHNGAISWISLIILLNECNMVKAAPAAPMACKTRSIFTTLWGGAVTTAALAVDMWADVPMFLFDIQYSRRHSQLLLKRMLGTFLLLWVPLYRPILTFKRAIETRILSSKAELDEADIAKLNILVTCTIWLALPAPQDISISHRLALNSYGKRKGLSEQSIRTSLEWPCAKWNLELLGQRHSGTAERSPFQEQVVLELSTTGKLRCLELGFQLPHLEELEALQTKTALATTIAALQAAGYLLGVVGRLAQRLEISAIEAIATAISILVLCQAALHKVSTGSCQRPMILHLQPQDQQRLVQDVEAATDSSKLNIHGRNMWSFVIVTTSLLLLLSGFSIAYAVHFLTSSRCLLCSLSAFFFQLSILNFFAGFVFYCIRMSRNEDGLRHEDTVVCLYSACAIPMVTSYILALVATVLEWDKFNTEGNNIYNWMLPHIG